MHSGPFGCLTKLGAKRVELVQKFVLRSRVGFFRNKGTRSTPCDPKLTFWCIRTILVHSYYLGACGTVRLPYETWCKMGGTSAKVRVQKFVPRSRVRIFRNERTGPTTLDPKLMFWCILYYLGALGTVWLPYETRC